jgi:hypothetical protein
LPIDAHDRLVVADSRWQVADVFANLPKLGRLAEALTDVDAMPSRDAARPIGRSFVDDAGKVYQPTFARSVVELKHAVQQITAPPFLPTAGQKVLKGDGHQPAAETEQERDDALVARRFVMRPQNLRRQHGRQQIPPTPVFFRTEVSASVLIGKDGVHPSARFLDKSFIAREVCKGGEAPQPVGQLFPMGMPFTTPLAQLCSSPQQTIRHQPQWRFQPTFGAEAARRQLDEGRGQQRWAIGGVEPLLTFPRHRLDAPHRFHLRSAQKGCHP